MAKKPSVEVMHSKECESVAKVLKDKGFLAEVKVFKPSESNVKMLHLDLAHDKTEYAITDVKRISKPGRRIYRGTSDLHRVEGGFGVAVVSTSKGIMADDMARKKKLGGEVLCEVF
jgi:small subunit ribosomal protein S8